MRCTTPRPNDTISHGSYTHAWNMISWATPRLLHIFRRFAQKYPEEFDTESEEEDGDEEEEEEARRADEDVADGSFEFWNGRRVLRWASNLVTATTSSVAHSVLAPGELPMNPGITPSFFKTVVVT